MRRNHSIIACSRHLYIGVVLHPHPVRGESHIQRNGNQEVATTSPTFYNEPHRSHILFMKVALCTTFTSWSQHHFVAIGKPEQQLHKASHCGSKQQYISCTTITLLLLVRATDILVLFFTHIPFVVNRTFNATPTARLKQWYKQHTVYHTSRTITNYETGTMENNKKDRYTIDINTTQMMVGKQWVKS